MRIRSRSIIIMISQGMSQATTIVLAIVLVRLVSEQIFGTYRQVFLIYGFLAGVLSLQIESSLYYFLPKLDDKLRRTLLAQTFVISLAIAAVAGGVLFLASGPIARLFNNPALAPLIRIFSLFPFADRLARLIPAFMISLDRPVRAGAYSFVESLGRITVVIIAFYLGCTLTTVIWSVVLVTAVVATIGCADMVRLSGSGRWQLDRGLVREQWWFTWPLWATAVVGITNLQFDRLLISSFFDPATYAVYSCGAIQLPVIAIVTASMSTAIMPNLIPLIDKGKKLDALNLWQEVARKSSLLIFPCFAFFLAVAPDFIVLLYGKGYWMATWPFAIYLCMLPTRVAIYATMFRAMGKTKPVAVSAVLALVINVVISTSLVLAGRKSHLSFVGPSIGTVIAQIVSVMYLLWQLGRAIGTPVRRIMRWKELGATFVLSVACGLVVFLIPLSGLAIPIRLAIKAVIFAVVLLGMILWTRMLHDDEKEFLLIPLRVIRRAVRRAKH